MVHIAVKFKARLLNQRVKLKIGPNPEAGVHHLEQLRSKYGKEHFLRDKDLNHHDRQNYDAVLHIINACPLLREIPGACATKCYVEIIQNVVDSYEDKSLDCISRIEKIWYANFFLRYWRKWILLHHLYTLQNNFITQNCYMCVELNAHAIIIYALTIRDHFQGDSRNFLPWMLGSQTCERTFRTVRSMSSVFSTVLNFSVLGLLRRLHRINIQQTLQADLQSAVKFPNLEKYRNKEGKKISEPLRIKDDEIDEAVQRAKAKARNTIQEMGMDKLLKVHSVWDKENTDLLAEIQDDDDDDDNVDDNTPDDENDENAYGCDSLAIIEEVCLETKEQVSNDIQSAYDVGLLSKEGKEKLQKIQKVLPVNKLKSDTIPMYSLKDHKDLDSCLTSLSSKTKQVFSPFVEVSVKGRVVLIRKTTAIWLFQETERVSADRIFRVRVNQPYASVNEPKETSSVKCLGQGDDVAVKKILRSDEMTLGTPSASTVKCHGQDNVVNMVVKKVLRSDETTVDTPSTSTVKVHGQDEDIVVKKVFNSNEIACVHDVIIINDKNDYSRASSDSIQAIGICKKSEKWLKIGSYVLCTAERDMLCNNEWLTDLHMNAVQVLLKTQFPHIGGLQNTTLLQSKSHTKPFTTGTGSLQIIHINNNHWVVASTMNCEHADITVYDSLNSSVSIETILASLLKTQKDHFKIQISKVNKQSGTKDWSLCCSLLHCCGFWKRSICCCLQPETFKMPSFKMFRKWEDVCFSLYQGQKNSINV